MPVRLRVHPAVFLAICAAASAGWLGIHALGESARHADEYMTALVEREHFSGSVLIARDGRTLFEEGYGFANAVWRIPNTPSTRFRIASISKTFTATLTLQLVEQGALRLDESICKYVEPCPPHWGNVTLHHLLSHTSGIFNHTADPGFHARKRLKTTPDEILASLRDRPLAFEPGAKFSYSNTNYTLLSSVIERVTGKPYEYALRGQILDPLGMSDTGVDRMDTLIESLASGYRFAADGYTPAEIADPSWGAGSGSLYSTVRDLAKWSAAFEDAKHLSTSMIQRMLTPVQSKYGYGWSIGAVNGAVVAMHAGRIDGFVSCIARFPEQRLTAVVLANREIKTHACTIASNLAAIGRGDHESVKIERHAMALDAALVQRYVGAYRFSDLTVIVQAEAGRLFASIEGQEGRWEMFAESETLFFFKAFDTDVYFELERDRPTSMHVRRPLMDELKGQRIRDAHP